MLPDDANMDQLEGARVCRHKPVTLNYVSVDQFGEQTYIKKGKMPGGLKGLTMKEDEVAIWVESYPICVHVTLAIESMYSADDEMKEETGQQKIMSESGVQIKRLLTTISQHQASIHAAMSS